MSNGSSSSDPEAADVLRHALVGLYALTPRFEDADPGLIPGFMPSSPGAALAAVAGAPENEVTVGAKLDLLHELARAGFPHYDTQEAGYRQLAASIAGPNELDPDQLLTDVKTAVSGDAPFATTASGAGLPHHVTVFLGREVCNTATVEVDGITATWIFSEFETDAAFAGVAEWVDPRNWTERGPMLFKQMEIVGSRAPTSIQPSLGDAHWHAVFREEVQLVTRVNTLLHCDYWMDTAAVPGRSAGMTYQLDVSLDGEINVDRGFLLVTDLGPVRRVKALKIVGFTTGAWDTVAKWVCPFWTDWVRKAVEGGTTTTPQPPSHVPSGGGIPIGGDAFDAWVGFLGESARTYLDLFGDVSGRALSARYSASDWVADGTQYWSQIATDWAKAWKYGLELLDDIADQGLDAGFMPPGAPAARGQGFATSMTNRAAGATPATREGTTIPIDGLKVGDQLSCSDLESIEAGGTRIPSSRVSVTVEPLGQNAFGARVSISDDQAPAGLYIGVLRDAKGTQLTPVQLYVSRASTVGGP